METAKTIVIVEARWPHGWTGALASGSCSPGLSPGSGHCAVFLGKTLLLSTYMFKWVPVNLMLGLTL